MGGARGAAEDGPKWDWGSGDSGPNGWAANFPDCGGKSQSPIDIVPELTSDPANLTVLGDMVNYSDEASFDVSQAYGSPKFSCSEAGTCGSVAAPDGTTYEVLQFHFHAPSENTINGMAYPLEMHIVHQNENGDLGVIGVLFTTEDVPDSDEAVAPPLEEGRRHGGHHQGEPEQFREPGVRLLQLAGLPDDPALHRGAPVGPPEGDRAHLPGGAERLLELHRGIPGQRPPHHAPQRAHRHSERLPDPGFPGLSGAPVFRGREARIGAVVPSAATPPSPPAAPVFAPPSPAHTTLFFAPSCYHLQLGTWYLQPATCNLQPATCNLQPATSHHVHWGREPELRLRDHVVAGMPSLFLHLTSAWGFGGGSTTPR